MYPSCSGRTQQARSPVADPGGQMVLLLQGAGLCLPACLRSVAPELGGSFSKSSRAHRAREVESGAESGLVLTHVPPELQKIKGINTKRPGMVGGSGVVVRQTWD